MYPYHHDPETDAAIHRETLAFFAWVKGKFKSLWNWLRSPMPKPQGHAQFVPSVSGMGSFWTECTTPGCNCGGARERWDMPHVRPDALYDAPPTVSLVVTGLPITDDLQKVFGHFGNLTGLLVQEDGSIEAHYGHRSVVRFLAITGPVRSVNYERL